MKHEDQIRLEQAAAQGRRPEDRPRNDVPAMDAATKVLLDHVHAVQSRTRMELDILRKTRGQRNVGEVKIPAHLQIPTPMDASGVESRNSVLPIQGPGKG